MRLFLTPVFLTLVLSGQLSTAAPRTKTTVNPLPMTAEAGTPLRPLPEELRDKPATSLIGIALGFAGGSYLERDQYIQGPFLSVRYMPLGEDQRPQWDYQVEVNQQNLVGLSMGHRWYCCPEDTFMPYGRLSAIMVLDPSSELAGLAEIRRWRLRSSVGIGETFVSEFGVGVAVTGTDLYAQFGFYF